MIRYARSFALFNAVVLLLGGCIAETLDSSATPVALQTPERLRQVSAVDTDQLSVELRVNNQLFPAVRQSDGSYMASVTVPANTDSRISVVWTELYNATSLKLAEQNRVVTVGDTALTIVLGDSYVTTGAGFDPDNDGFSNLAERTQGTDPLSADDRPDAAALQISVALPDDILSLGNTVTLEATLNNEPVVLQRVGTGVATATVSGLSSSAETTFELEITGGGVLLASARKSIVLLSGDANSLSVAQTDFDTSIDTDEDNISNLIEVLRGTDPRAVADYRIRRVFNAPLVDGSLSDTVWRNRLNQDNALLINRLIMADDGEQNVTTDGLYSAWAAVTDGETLFIAVRIIDDVIRMDSDELWWQDDAVELFIDGDNSKQTGNYDRENDYHMAFRVQDQSLIRGGRSLGLPANLVFEMSASEFDADIASGAYPSDLELDGDLDVGFNLEIAVPLDELDIDDEEPFGINVHYDDDDDGGGRNAKYAWVGRFEFDIDYLEPSSLGTAITSE